MANDWGTITVGRIALREVFSVSESGGEGRKLSVDGQEASPDLTRDELVARHDNLLALEGTVVPVTFTDKPERNGYYTVESVAADLTEWRGDVVKCDWKLSLARQGTQGETDLQSRLTGAVRVNPWGLTGERWHAPPIGHYGYFTGSSNPGVLTREGEDGAILVYRQIPAGVSPRWGCDPTDYMQGRVRFVSAGMELTGVDQECSPTDWELSNGLVNVTPSGSGDLNVQAYTDGGWRSKLWRVFSDVSTQVVTWDAVNLLHNEPEAVIVRLTKSLDPGRLQLDLTLRRGSRFVEGYLHRGTAADELKVRLAVDENYTAPASAGYVVATDDDADGNRFIAGSASNFTPHASGGVVLASTTRLDFFLGVVAGGGSAVAGDDAEALTGQYIAALPERIYGVRR